MIYYNNAKSHIALAIKQKLQAWKLQHSFEVLLFR